MTARETSNRHDKRAEELVRYADGTRTMTDISRIMGVSPTTARVYTYAARKLGKNPPIVPEYLKGVMMILIGADDELQGQLERGAREHDLSVCDYAVMLLRAHMELAQKSHGDG